MQKRIDRQRKKLEKGNPVIELSRSCRINNGIISLDDSERKKYIKLFEDRNKRFSVTHFIPASGSGSRMFDTLYDFIQDNTPANKSIEDFRNNLKEFAFYHSLPYTLKADLENLTISFPDFVRLLLSYKVTFNNGEKTGLNFGNLPKGLIPFHQYENMIVNAFQEHILQGHSISGEKSTFHFTINADFENQIHESIEAIKKLKEIHFSHTFSIQDKESDAIAFDNKNLPIKDEDDNIITRPAGHGAILSNLNTIESDLVFIRNIDNIQHQTKAAISIETRKALAGILIELQETIFEILDDVKINKDYEEKLTDLNNRFDLRIPINKFSNSEFIFNLLNRPIRICGMVKNEGQPGGGPFWIVDDDGFERRQIVEKSQMSNDAFQLAEVIKSTHFNPVELVCSFKNFKGEKFDLNEFKNEDLYFIVNKTHQGKPIQYIEEPGLWNGAMEKWTTLFYEIDSNCFSPVKTVLDLLGPLHR